MAADDCGQTIVLAGLAEREPGLPARLLDSFFRAAGGGHFKPVQDVLLTTSHRFFGNDGWARGVIALYMLLHVASGLLLRSLALSAGVRPGAALAAAALFLLHPAIDEALACVLYAPNIPGLFLLLLAARLWWDGAEAPRRTMAALFVLYLAMGCNLIFVIAGPLLLGAISFLRTGAGAPSPRTLLRHGLLLGLVAGATFIHRKLAYGEFLTRVGGYDASGPAAIRDPVRFLRDAARALVLLAPSGTIAGHRTEDPGEAAVSGGGHLDILLAAVVALALVAAIAGARRDPAAPSGPAPRRRAPALLASVLFLAVALPYAFFLPSYALHRYSHPAAAGAALAVAALLDAATRRIRRPAIRGVALAAAVAPILFLFVLVDRRAARDIAAGHETVRVAGDLLTEALRPDPAITRMSVLGLPLATGRAGFAFGSDRALRNHLFARLRRKFEARHDVTAVAAWASGEDPLPPPPDHAVFALQREREQLLRIRDLTALPEGSPAETRFRRLLRAAWRPWNSDALDLRLADPHPELVRLALWLLGREEHPSRTETIAKALGSLRRAVPATPTDPAAFAGLAMPRATADAIRLLSPERPAGLAAILDAALDAPSEDPEIAEAVLAATGFLAGPERIRCLAALALRTDDAGRRAGEALLGAAPEERRRGASDALESVRTIVARLRAGAVDPGAASALDEVRAHGGLLVESPFVSRLRWRLELAAGDFGTAASTLQSAAREAGALISEETAFVAATRRGEFPRDFHIRVAFPAGQPAPRAGGSAILLAIVEAGDGFLPGGFSPHAPRLAWSWTAGDAPGAPPPRGIEWLPEPGLGAGCRVRIPCRILMPDRPGRFTFRLELASPAGLHAPPLQVEGIDILPPAR